MIADLNDLPKGKLLYDLVLEEEPSLIGLFDYFIGKNKMLNAHELIIKKRFHDLIKYSYFFSKQYGLELDEAIQESLLAYYEHVIVSNKKDSQKALYWVIRRTLFDQDRLIRIPFHLKESLSKLVDNYDKHFDRNSDESLRSNITVLKKLSFFMDSSQERIMGLINLYNNTYHLLPLTNNIGFEDIMDVEIDNKEFEGILRNVLNTLSPMENQVICLRYGIGYVQRMTLSEVASILGDNRESIRQIEAMVLRKLRHPRRLKKLRRNFPESFNLVETCFEDVDIE